MPNLFILAGPNGAGKSTFYKSYLEEKALPFINADVLAAQLDIDAYEAAKVAETMRLQLLDERKSFIFETVFSDPVGAKLEFMKGAADMGYNVTLFFIGLENPTLSSHRVKARVQAGGHDVPEEKLQQRYQRTLDNLRKAIQELPRVVIFDNSKPDDPYRFIGEFQAGSLTRRGDGAVPGWASEFVK